MPETVGLTFIDETDSEIRVELEKDKYDWVNGVREAEGIGWGEFYHKAKEHAKPVNPAHKHVVDKKLERHAQSKRMTPDEIFAEGERMILKRQLVDYAEALEGDTDG